MSRQHVLWRLLVPDFGLVLAQPRNVHGIECFSHRGYCNEVTRSSTTEWMPALAVSVNRDHRLIIAKGEVIDKCVRVSVGV